MHSVKSSASGQPMNINIYLNSNGAGALAPVAPPAAAAASPTAAQLAVEQSEQVQQQLKAQDKQIQALLGATKPKQAASALSGNIEAVLASAVSDMSKRLHTANPIQTAAQLGIPNPVAIHESSALSTTVTAAQAANGCQGCTQAQAAHLKKVMEIDGLLLKDKARQQQLVGRPPVKHSEAQAQDKARMQKLASSAREELASAESREVSIRRHQEAVQALQSAGTGRQQLAQRSTDRPTLDVSKDLFKSENGVTLPQGEADSLKHDYRSQMYKLDRAAGDAENMKITGSISDLIPQALFHALNRQNVIHTMYHPPSEHKGFPARPNADRVFGHSVPTGLKLPSDAYVIKENDRMLTGLEMAAGYHAHKSAARRSQSSQDSGARWGHIGTDRDNVRSSAKFFDDMDTKDARPLDHDSIPVLKDGWGQNDEGTQRTQGSAQSLADWKTDLKSRENRLGFKGLMAEQERGVDTRHSELEDAQHAARDGWLR
jgi:hypothetical protein